MEKQQKRAIAEVDDDGIVMTKESRRGEYRTDGRRGQGYVSWVSEVKMTSVTVKTGPDKKSMPVCHLNRRHYA